MRWLFFVAATVALISLILYIPVWRDDAESRRNTIIVRNLISVGQNLYDAQSDLKNEGFELLYDEPVTPTINRDYLLQLVIVGNTHPNVFETIAYTVGLSWSPFTHAESAYVEIRADLDGTITSIE